MTFFEVLVEGASDVSAVREVLTRKFQLVENADFRIHPHRGRGNLPANPLARPDPKQQTLLHQLPAKLKGFSYLGANCCVVVVVDADDTACVDFLAQLNGMLAQLPQKPQRVLFRLAIEETESWFIADEQAIRSAFPNARTQALRAIAPDAIVGAWEMLADALRVRRVEVTGTDKFAWSAQIAPYLDLDQPRSPSLGKLIQGVGRELQRNVAP